MAMLGGRGLQTDDRGVYCAYGLDPGIYKVSGRQSFRSGLYLRVVPFFHLPNKPTYYQGTL